jgi:SAM-dependent methyltransferase
MNWAHMRNFPWLDTRARFVTGTLGGGNLLDIGSSDGETLGHIHELRPDLHLFSVDIDGRPDQYPAGCEYRRTNVEQEALPWPDRSMDAVTCMHLVEHLQSLDLLVSEVSRVLKPGGRAYFETPHPKTVALPSPPGGSAGTFTLNFYDDPTHVRPVGIGALAQQLRGAGLSISDSGTSRNWLFAAAWPALMFAPPSRKKFTARVHWLGWSAYLTACRPL